MALNRVGTLTLSWRDAKGVVAKTRMWLHYDVNAAGQGTNIDAIIALMTPLSNASLASYSGPAGEVAGAVQFGTVAVYEAAEDKAVLFFQAAAGDLHRMEIPAPVAGLFLADGKTVDPTNVAFQAFVTEVLASSTAVEIGTRDGRHFVNYVGGYRKMRKLSRKLNIFVLTPSLTVDEPAE